MSVAPFAYQVGERVRLRGQAGTGRVARREMDHDGTLLYWIRRPFRAVTTLVAEEDLEALGALSVEGTPSMPWTVFEQPRYGVGGPRQDTAPYVAILPKGTLSINALAYEAMGKPPYVELMYDTEMRLIGLRPATEARWHARKVSLFKGAKSASVNALPFLEHFQIPHEVRVRLAAVWVGDVLVLDLKGAPA